MSTILSQFNPSFKTHQLKPNEQDSTLFTCIACQVAFPTSERQRNHYRTDWHKYNLKRKIASLSSVSAEQFTQKVLAQQAQGREELEKQGLIYECPLCKKTYLSENAYNNHVQSKKHSEMEQKADKEEKTSNESTSALDSSSILIVTKQVKKDTSPLLDCLFCSHTSIDINTNLQHMSKCHGFFLPDIEYLKDLEGLVSYLLNKIQNDNLCLYCNGRGREWQSAAAARAHMMDRGHCKMAYDESEDPEQLLQYYNFDIGEEFMDNTFPEKKLNEDELILQSGMKLGHRKFLKNYKKKQARKTLVHEEESLQLAHDQPEPLRRQERRHLTITDGQEQEIRRTADGIKEAALSKEFSRKVAFKQNSNQTRRARIQNPI